MKPPLEQLGYWLEQFTYRYGAPTREEILNQISILKEHEQEQLKLSIMGIERISDLKAIHEVCAQMGRTNSRWKNRAEMVEEILINKVDQLFK